MRFHVHPSHIVQLGAFVLVLLAAGCGDDPAPGADAGPPDNELVILGPGDDVGLSYNERINLRVRYQTELGEWLGGEPVEFALLTTGPGENTAGSVLSATRVITDSQGVAAVDLVAGAADASFRVRVDARDAPTRYFYIEISDGGFARLRITPTHQGWRPLDSFSRVEVRLYRADELTCHFLDIDNRPFSFSPPRSLDAFGGTVEYQSVAAGQALTVVAWAQAAGNTVPVSAGCVDLGALPPVPVEMAVTIDDRPLVADASPVVTTLGLEPVAQALALMDATRPWDVLGCPAGPGQLLLECALDAAAGDGALDCRATGESPLESAVEARRGALGADGCRALVDSGGMPSLDALLTDAAQGEEFPGGGDLAEMLAVRSELLGQWVLSSELTSVAEDALAHGLTTLEVSTSAGDFALELRASSRPVVVQSPVDAAWQGADLSADEHAFTLRAGQFAARALLELALVPAGVSSQADSLGSALAASLRHEGATSCQALSQLVCTDIGQSDTCLMPACSQGAAALDVQMTAWWRALDASDLDFIMGGQMRAHDDDGDRIIEAVGPTPDAPAPWSATMILADGSELALTTGL